MSSRQWLFLIVFGLVGYLVLGFLFFRFDAATHWQYSDDRGKTLDEAKRFTQLTGTEVSGWKSIVRVRRTRDLERFLISNDDHSLTVERGLLSPIRSTATFIQPRTGAKVEVTISASGWVTHFSRPQTGITGSSGSSDTEIASKYLSILLGSNAGLFSLKTDAADKSGVHRFVWTFVSPQNNGLVVNAQMELSNGTMLKWDLDPQLPPGYERANDRGEATVAVLASFKILLNVVLVLAALAGLFLSFSRKQVDLVSTLALLLVDLILVAVANLLTGTLDDFLGGQYSNVSNPGVISFLAHFLFFLVVVGMAFLAAMFWATGEAISARSGSGSLDVFASFLRGRVLNRIVARNILAGFLLGGIVASVPYLAAALFRLKSIPMDFPGREDLLASSAPLLAIFADSLSISGNQYFLLLAFGFVAPLIGLYFNRRLAGKIIFALLSFILLSDLATLQAVPAPVRIGSYAVIIALYGYFYLRSDLLAVLVAGASSEIAVKSLTFLAQPSSSLNRTGITALVILGLAGIAAAIAARLLPEVEIIHRDTSTQLEEVAERERLKAEFGIAQRAQEKLLPATRPELPGFDIAAICRPARECAGDLFDFVQMPNGQMAVIVADVSGKGVPAALYMTLTKGLLTSVIENESDPGEILRKVNKHLYAVCKRKVFVTLFLAIIDPQTRKISFARAGHNPPIWRRMAAGKTEMIRPSGIGLGLDSGKAFNRTLKVASIEPEPGDLLVLYSDGISEAMNAMQEEYGEERLMKASTIVDGMQAEEALSGILADVGSFLMETSPQDDQTLVVIRVN